MLNGRCFSHVRDNMAKVKRAMEEAKIEILVGYPSGMTHIETTHKVNPETGERVTGTRDGGDLAELAEKLHYGTADIPSRPFLEDGLNENQDELRKALAKELDKLKETGRANLDKIGVMAVSGIQELVKSGYYKGEAPNAPLTVYLKGSDTPLIDGANMIDSLRYVKIQNGRITGGGGAN